MFHLVWDRGLASPLSGILPPQTSPADGGFSDSVRILDRLSAVLIPLLLLVAGALYTGVTVVGELVDDHGRVVVDVDGEPLLVVAAWETWKVNWLPNVLFLLAAGLLLRMFYQEVAARYFRSAAVVRETGG